MLGFHADVANGDFLLQNASDLHLPHTYRTDPSIFSR